MEDFNKTLKNYFGGQGMNQSAIGEKLGLSRTIVNNYLNGQKNFGRNSAMRWAKAFNIDPLWLMSHGEQGTPPIIGKTQSDATLVTFEEHHTLLLPTSAMAGTLSGFASDPTTINQCERIISPIADVDFAIPVLGDSMETEYPNGSRVLIKKIDDNSFIAWGNVFVLDTINGVLLKQLQPSMHEDALQCVSLNTTGNRYKPFDVPKKDIFGIYRVLMCIAPK